MAPSIILRSAIIWVSFALFSVSLAEERCYASAAKPILLALSNCTMHRSNGQTVESWGLSLSVGSQDVCLVPSTVTNNTLIMGTDVCANDRNSTSFQCNSRRGGLFDLGVAASSFVKTSLGDLRPDQGWAEIMKPLPPFTVAGNTTLQLSDASVPLTIAVVTEGQNHTTGQLGLGIESSVLDALVQQKKIDSPVWGINAGSQSSNPRDGSLVLGGYDQASVSGHFTNFSMDYPINRHPGGRVCPLQVVIERLVLRPTGGDDIAISDLAQPIQACIEPYDNLFRLPSLTLGLFQQKTAWSAQTTHDPNILVMEPGLLYPSSVGFNGSLLFQLNNGFEVEIPNEELQHPVRGLNQKGARVVQNNVTEVNVYFQAAPLDTAVLGKAFLSKVQFAHPVSGEILLILFLKVYMFVNSTDKQFRLARMVSNNNAPNPVSPSSQIIIECRDHGLSRAAIAAIVIGIILALVIIAALVFYIRRWRKRTKTKPVRPQGAEAPHGEVGYDGPNELEPNTNP